LTSSPDYFVMCQDMIYLQFIRFLLPLVLTMIVQELSTQVLNGGMARMPRALETLASFGLAWGLVSILVSPLSQIRQVGLVLVDSRQSLHKVSRFVLLSGLGLATLLASLSFGPLAAWVLDDLHALTPPLSLAVRAVLFWCIPIPFLRGLNLFYSGLLMRIRRTDIVSYAILAGIGASTLTVFGLLPVNVVQTNPIWLPLLVTYAGVLSELGVILWSYRRYVRPVLQDPTGSELLSYTAIVNFFWPLALIMVIQGFSRPLINPFVARGTDGPEALAVLTVVYSLSHMAYGWVNEIRCLPPAFSNKVDSLKAIRRFALLCGSVSFGVMLLLFWTPLRGYVLETLIGIDPGLAARCTTPLMIFSCFPLVVMFRGYYHGIGLLERRTSAMAPSAPVRVGAILATLVLLTPFAMSGATRGVIALLNGFIFETLTVWWGLRGRRYSDI